MGRRRLPIDINALVSVPFHRFAVQLAGPGAFRHGPRTAPRACSDSCGIHMTLGARESVQDLEPYSEIVVVAAVVVLVEIVVLVVGCVVAVGVAVAESHTTVTSRESCTSTPGLLATTATVTVSLPP